MLQEASINTLLFMGAARAKLVLGLPLYGRIFKLRNPAGNIGFRNGSEGAGMQGPYVQEAGLWGYNEVSFCSCDGISRRETL
jgi:chitinase